MGVITYWPVLSGCVISDRQLEKMLGNCNQIFPVLLKCPYFHHSNLPKLSSLTWKEKYRCTSTPTPSSSSFFFNVEVCFKWQLHTEVIHLERSCVIDIYKIVHDMDKVERKKDNLFSQLKMPMYLNYRFDPAWLFYCPFKDWKKLCYAFSWISSVLLLENACKIHLEMYCTKSICDY